MTEGFISVWMRVLVLFQKCVVVALLCGCAQFIYREFVMGVRCYVYAYLLYGKIIVSRSWSVMNGELCAWMWM